MTTSDEKTQRSQHRTLRRTSGDLKQLNKALRQLSGISALLNKQVRRSGKHLRSVLSFDELNRLNAPLKGSSRSSRRRRSTRRGGSSARRSGWNLSEALKGLRGLGRLLSQVWQRLRLFFQSRRWTLPKGFEALSKAALNLGRQLRGALSWGYEHILRPLARWTIDKAAPAAMEALGAALETISKAFELLSRFGTAVWDGVLAPLAGFTADLAISALGALKDLFVQLTGSFEGLLNCHPVEWLKNNLIDPLSRIDPLSIPVALSKGPKELWNSFKEAWEKNPAVQQLVKLAKDGWSSVKDWAGKHLGGGLSKAVGLVRDGWSSVKDWVSTKLGGGVSCAVNLLKGWKGTVAKALGLNKLSTRFNIKLPKVVITWSKGRVPLPSFSLKWNKRGGILDGATLFGMAGNTLLGGGEAGREAILPLERNTGWMDELARRLAGRLDGDGRSVQVQVVLDGKVLAESTVRQLKDLARQGRFPLSGLV